MPHAPRGPRADSRNDALVSAVRERIDGWGSANVDARERERIQREEGHRRGREAGGGGRGEAALESAATDKAATLEAAAATQTSGQKMAQLDSMRLAWR